MTEWEIREQMCEIGRRVWQRGYVAANDGNFSFRVDDGRVLTTPTLVSKGFMSPEDICEVDMEGEHRGGRRKATSEVLMHIHIYEKRPDVRAIVHAHPPHATAFAVNREPIPKCVLPEVELSLGEIPILPYATPGTQDLAETFDPHLGDFNVFLMANHGALAMGEDLMDAYFKLEVVDQYCRILILSRQLGHFSRLSPESMGELFNIKERLGIPDRRLKPGGTISCDVPSPAPGVPCQGDVGACPLSDAPLSETEIQRIVDEVIESVRGRIPGR